MADIYITGGSTADISKAAHAGTWGLLALGINAIGGIDQPWLPAWITGPWAGANSISVIQGSVCRVSWSASSFPCFAFSFDPVAYYVLIVTIIILAVILVSNLYRSRLGRAWMAIR